MSQVARPSQEFQFRGVYLAGNPLKRPMYSANVCEDLRIMPGLWPRLRGGRRARYFAPGTVQQIHPFHLVDQPGSNNQLVQINHGGGVVKLTWFSLLTYIMDTLGVIQDVNTTYDGGYASTHPIAICNLIDRPLFYNGLGVRGTDGSRPPFCTYYNGATRYFGLDANPIGGKPGATFTVGSGWNKVLNAVDIYVGLHAKGTEHYSNGVFAGTVAGTAGRSGTITVDNLNTLVPVYNNGTEHGELEFVFYASIDGGKVAYLILNQSLDGPLAVPSTSGAFTLSQSSFLLSSTDNGWVLDLTSEMPTENYPPRPMRSVAYANGRLYGALISGGSGAPGVDFFTYIPTARETAAVVWSKAAGDDSTAQLLGDPLQCWPTTNICYTPSGEQPLVIVPSIDEAKILVLTATKAFHLIELAGGLHVFQKISALHGIGPINSLRETEHGLVWTNQRNEIVRMAPGTSRVDVLSDDYQDLLSKRVVQCADYIIDPLHDIDRYQVWLDDTTSVIHDFKLADEGSPAGQAYTSTGQDFTAAASTTDAQSRVHHIVAKQGVYTHEVQPEDGQIPTTDDVFADDGLSVSIVEPTGTFNFNWNDFGDPDLKKQMPLVDAVGDGRASEQLSGSPLELTWWSDFQETSDANAKPTSIVKRPQSTTDQAWRFHVPNANAFWYKFRLKIFGHSTDDAAFATHTHPGDEGNLARNFYGAVLSLAHHLGIRENRS